MPSSNPVSLRPAWVEIDQAQLRRNFALINADKPAGLHVLAVVKDDAYGHGAVAVAQAALQAGTAVLGVAIVDEALELRTAGIDAPILVLGERTGAELPVCVEHNLTCCINDLAMARELAALARKANRRLPLHVEIDTGLSRYGVRWTRAAAAIREIAGEQELLLDGIMSHFAMSDELDKSFALLQLGRFTSVLHELEGAGLRARYRHFCNTGGYLDLPQAHFDLVRIGILPLGVYPSQVCRRIAALQPVLQVKTRVAALQQIDSGDKVGYGMHYTAPEPRTIAVLPVGYGDGYPRLRNQGEVLVHGQRAPIAGGNAMDAMMIDVTEIAGVAVGDEVVLLGRQGVGEIDVHEIARLKRSVSYDILTGWRSRLPRRYLDDEAATNSGSQA